MMNAVAGVLFVLSAGRGPDSLEARVVARVGDFLITAKDLITSFEFGPSFVQRSPNPLAKHLEFMINERLLALDARKRGHDTSTFVRERVAALEEDLAVDRLYREDILTKVKVTDEDLEQGISKATMQLRLRWIFVGSKREADSLSSLIKSGTRFDTLFKSRQNPNGKESSHSLETDYLRLECDNREFAQSIRHLRSQEVSEPLEGPDGYYIVRVDEIWRNPVARESEYAQMREQTLEILRQIRADEQAGEYVRTEMTSANPAIKAEGLNILRAFLAQKGLSHDKRLEWNIPSTFMTEAGPRPIQESGDFLYRPLVTFGGRTLTVGDYVRWFDIRQFQLNTRSPPSFTASVKRTVWKMVQDRLLSEEAYARRLERHVDVVKETKGWRVKLLYLARRRDLINEIQSSDEEIRAYFAKNKRRYATGSLENVKQEVLADLFFEKEQAVLFRTLDKLKKHYGVHVDNDLLASLAGRVEPHEPSVNVIFYKPGGTFPRVAVPTIDEAWQRYAQP